LLFYMEAEAGERIAINYSVTVRFAAVGIEP
jgi:hypothetical protein